MSDTLAIIARSRFRPAAVFPRELCLLLVLRAGGVPSPTVDHIENLLVLNEYLISDTPPYLLNLDAPTIPAEPIINDDGVVMCRVWCKRSQEWHHHGPGDGHREAHCRDNSSPFWGCGYNLAVRTTCQYNVSF